MNLYTLNQLWYLDDKSHTSPSLPITQKTLKAYLELPDRSQGNPVWYIYEAGKIKALSVLLEAGCL